MAANNVVVVRGKVDLDSDDGVAAVTVETTNGLQSRLA
jgi:hypothetical protein